MSKFEVGQEVLFDMGYLRGIKGVVVDPHFQISQSDWPEVVIQYGDRTISVEIDDVRPAEDPYEYAVASTYIETGKPETVRPELFTTLKDAKKDLKLLTTGEGGAFYRDKYTFKLVKRRKAGPVEDA